MIQLFKRLGTQRSLALANLAITVGIGLGAFRLLPVRALSVAVLAVVAMALLLASGAGLALRAPWAVKVTRVAGVVLFVEGILAVAALTLAVTLARAVVASSAGPGAHVYGLIALLVFPYTVLYGIVLLVWANGQGRAP
jgi:hypothetical protein